MKHTPWEEYKNFPPVTEPDGSVLYLHEPASDPYAESKEYSRHSTF
jgi:hypothetical protein